MYQRRIMLERPHSAWSLDTVAATYPDIAGGTNDALQVGNPAESYVALVAGAGGSIIVADDATIEYPNSVVTNDRGLRAFSLEAWIKPINLDGPIVILGHDLNSGLILDGFEIQFTLPFDVPYTCSYTFKDVETYHVVGVFDGSSLLLYVNGVLQDTQALEPESIINGFGAFPQDELVTGDTAEIGQLLAIDSPALYSFSLTSAQIESHFLWGRRVRSVEEIVGGGLGTWHSFTDDRTSRTFVRTYASAADWETTKNEDVVISDDGVQPADDENLDSLPGTLDISVSLGEDGEQIHAIKIDWIAEGDYIVETSLDGTTYVPTTNHSLVAAVTQPFVIFDENVYARITFTGGVPDDESIVRSLTLTVYADEFASSSYASRIATLDGNVILAETHNEPIEQNDLRGARIDGGSIVISEDADADDPQDINAVELWVKFNVLSGAFYVMDSRSTGTTTRARLHWNGSTMVIDGLSGRIYVNGPRIETLSSVVWETGRWYHIIITYTSDFNEPVYLGREYDGSNDADTDMQIGHVAFYRNFPLSSEPTVSDFTGQDVLDQYLGITRFVIEDDAATVTEPADPADLYAYEWVIEPSV
jgi:hypothetical protein